MNFTNSTIYKTDKYEHGYIPIYEKVFKEFREKEINLLEIGVFEGESLKLWRAFFPRAKIVGVEINPKHCLAIEGCKIINADATKPFQFMEGPWDIIIDDGSHKFDDIISSYCMLYPFLKSKGSYVIEDIYGSYDTMKVIDYLVNKHKQSFGRGDSIELSNQLAIIYKL